MNCATHPEAPAIAYCRECGKPLCELCRYQAGGTIYCGEHSPVTAQAAPLVPPAAYAAPEPPTPPTPPAPPDSPYTAPEPSPYAAPEASSPYTAPGQPYTSRPTSQQAPYTSEQPPYASQQTPYTAPPPRPRSSHDASPGLAFMLGFIPGVGAVYNGQYVKGLIHVVVMGLLIAIVNDQDLSSNLQPLFGMMIAVWVFYMAFEAYHTAKKRQFGEPVDEFSSIVPRRGQPARLPFAPTILIIIGVIFLLHNLDILRISQILRYWPIALIGLGVYMLYERLSGSSDPRNGRTSSGSQPGAQPGGHV